MNKKNQIIIGCVAVLAIVAVILTVVFMNSKPKTNFGKINSAEDLSNLVNQVYEEQDESMTGSLQTQVIDVSDDAMVKSFTGLESGKDLEYLVVSEPMMSSQAYSFVLATVKEGVNANEIAEKMKDNIDYRKWICVSAEKIYTTSSGNIVCLVMSSEEMAKPVYEKFKTLAGQVGQEFEKSEEQIDLPPEMY